MKTSLNWMVIEQLLIGWKRVLCWWSLNVGTITHFINVIYVKLDFDISNTDNSNTMAISKWLASPKHLFFKCFTLDILNTWTTRSYQTVPGLPSSSRKMKVDCIYCMIFDLFPFSVRCRILTCPTVLSTWLHGLLLHS